MYVENDSIKILRNINFDKFKHIVVIFGKQHLKSNV